MLAATWAVSTARDEVVRAGDRIAVYWGWMIGAFVWCMTPWSSSFPEALVDPLSNPDGNTLFTLSEAAGAYFGGGPGPDRDRVPYAPIIKLCCWWLSKR